MVRRWVGSFCVSGVGAARFVRVGGGDPSEETRSGMGSSWLKCELLSCCEIFK